LLALCPMSTVPQTSQHRTASDDAPPRAERIAHAHAHREAAAAPKPPMQTAQPLDATLDDPYDNVACTD
jgi:hypothetical protein